MAVRSITSRAFSQNRSGAKKAAAKGPVVITDRGRPTHVLLTYEDYQNLAGIENSGTTRTIIDMLYSPQAASVDVEFLREPYRPRDVDLS